MSSNTHRPVLHMVCGKIAAGKSTLTQRLAAEPATVLISEDAWLATLYRARSASCPTTCARRAG